MQKLRNVQNQIQVSKDRYNNFGNYNYRSAEDILEAARPLCIEQGLMLKVFDDIVEVGGRVYVKSTALVKDDQGNSEETTAFAREPEARKGMDASQITGMASSYARKYALGGLFCLDDTKDADTDENEIQKRKADKRENYDIEMATEQQIKTLKTVVTQFEASENPRDKAQAEKLFKEIESGMTRARADIVIRQVI